MSRTPVREALLQLEAEGLVSMEARKGVIVTPITRRDMREIIDIISALEVTAVERLAEQHPTPGDLAPLTKACDAMAEAIAAEDRDAWSAADEDFHRSLLRLSGNRHLAETGIKFRDKIRRGHFVAIRIVPDGRMQSSLANHRRLVELLAGKPQEAVALHLQQRVSAGVEIMNSLERLGLTML